MLASATKRRQSIAIITRRFRRPSTHGPRGTATTAPTASPAAASSDTSTGRACSARIATIGNESNASHVPNVLTANAPHSHLNCESGEPPRTRATLSLRPWPGPEDTPSQALPGALTAGGAGRARPATAIARYHNSGSTMGRKMTAAMAPNTASQPV